MTASEALSESLENYLKAIFLIIAEKQAARAKDIAARMKVGSSSVTGALRALTERGLVNYAPYDVITLTPEGARIAADVLRRHDAISSFMTDVLRVDPTTAREAACRMEHVIPEDVLERIIHFVQFVHSCPEVGPRWIEEIGYMCEQGPHQSTCDTCNVAETVGHDAAATKGGAQKNMGIGLPDLELGKRGKVLKVSGKGETKKRIVEMGMTPGAIVEIIRIAPLGDPIEVKVRGYSLSVRKEEARGITVEPL